jgi:hypothetical protein
MRTTLLAIAIALTAVGCTHTGDAARAKRHWLDPATAPPDAAELRYLVDRDTGRVFMEVPPPVLARLRLRLYTTGREEVADQIGKLYDLQTGRVRNPDHAKAAELRIRGPNAPPLQTSTPVAGASDASNRPPLPPALPASAGGVLPGTREGAGTRAPDTWRMR